MCAPQTDPQAPMLSGTAVPGPVGAGGPGSPDNSFMCMETPGTTGVNDSSSKNYSGEYAPVATCMAVSAEPFPSKAALAAIRRHEGYTNYMYLDTKSLITVGVGWNLMSTGVTDTPTPAAKGLPWLERATGQSPADPAKSLQDAWTILRKLSKPKGAVQPEKAIFFKDKTDLYIDDAKSDNPLAKQFATHIRIFSAALREIFKDFDSYPLPAKDALLDMVMMGPGVEAQEEIKSDPAHGIKGQAGHPASGLRAYAQMRAAVEKRDWKTAAQQCDRKGVADVRNAWTRSQFIQATSWECVEAG